MTICESFLKSIIGERVNVYVHNSDGDYRLWLECAELSLLENANMFAADGWAISEIGKNDVDVRVCGDAVDIYFA